MLNNLKNEISLWCASNHSNFNRVIFKEVSWGPNWIFIKKNQKKKKKLRTEKFVKKKSSPGVMTKFFKYRLIIFAWISAISWWDLQKLKIYEYSLGFIMKGLINPKFNRNWSCDDFEDLIKEFMSFSTEIWKLNLQNHEMNIFQKFIKIMKVK